MQSQRIESRSHRKHQGKSDGHSTFFADISGVRWRARTQLRERCSHHHTAMAAMTADSVIAGHPGDAQLVALASQYFRKFDTMAADLSLT